MTADLVSFLRERLAELDTPDWHERTCQTNRLMPPGSPMGLSGKPMTCNCMAVTRAWRKMEATRRIVERYKNLPSWAACWDECPDCGFQGGGWLLRVLALPYSDHSDYREDWKP